jgi:hypothetical protein
MGLRCTELCVAENSLLAVPGMRGTVGLELPWDFQVTQAQTSWVSSKADAILTLF